jgi:predicted  nucleic acid-binding Zn-ribbon protein
VDDGIKRPEYIEEQVTNRHQELHLHGDSLDGDVARARLKLVEVDEERAVYQRQLGRKRITEAEFDAHIDETEKTREYWQTELTRIQDLRDNQDKVQAGLKYARELLVALQNKLSEIDQAPEELKALPRERQTEILQARRVIVRALVDKVIIYSSGHREVQGVIDGSAACLVKQNELPVP